MDSAIGGATLQLFICAARGAETSSKEEAETNAEDAQEKARLLRCDPFFH